MCCFIYVILVLSTNEWMWFLKFSFFFSTEKFGQKKFRTKKIRTEKISDKTSVRIFFCPNLFVLNVLNFTISINFSASLEFSLTLSHKKILEHSLCRIYFLAPLHIFLRISRTFPFCRGNKMLGKGQLSTFRRKIPCETDVFFKTNFSEL